MLVRQIFVVFIFLGLLFGNTKVLRAEIAGGGAPQEQFWQLYSHVGLSKLQVSVTPVSSGVGPQEMLPLWSVSQSPTQSRTEQVLEFKDPSGHLQGIAKRSFLHHQAFRFYQIDSTGHETLFASWVDDPSTHISTVVHPSGEILGHFVPVSLQSGQIAYQLQHSLGGDVLLEAIPSREGDPSVLDLQRPSSHDSDSTLGQFSEWIFKGSETYLSLLIAHVSYEEGLAFSESLQLKKTLPKEWKATAMMAAAVATTMATMTTAATAVLGGTSHWVKRWFTNEPLSHQDPRMFSDPSLNRAVSSQDLELKEGDTSLKKHPHPPEGDSLFARAPTVLDGAFDWGSQYFSDDEESDSPLSGPCHWISEGVGSKRKASIWGSTLPPTEHQKDALDELIDLLEKRISAFRALRYSLLQAWDVSHANDPRLTDQQAALLKKMEPSPSQLSVEQELQSMLSDLRAKKKHHPFSMPMAHLSAEVCMENVSDDAVQGLSAWWEWPQVSKCKKKPQSVPDEIAPRGTLEQLQDWTAQSRVLLSKGDSDFKEYTKILWEPTEIRRKKTTEEFMIETSQEGIQILRQRLRVYRKYQREVKALYPILSTFHPKRLKKMTRLEKMLLMEQGHYPSFQVEKFYNRIQETLQSLQALDHRFQQALQFPQHMHPEAPKTWLLDLKSLQPDLLISQGAQIKVLEILEKIQKAMQNPRDWVYLWWLEG